MKHTLTAIVLAIPLAASAWEVEAAIGSTIHTKSNDTDWWQSGPASEGFRDDFRLRTNSYSIGVTEKSGALRYRAGYTNLGRVSSVAVATTDDATYDNDNHRCRPGCQMQYYLGSGEVDGIYGTVAYEFKVSDFTAYVEGGAWVYRTQFLMQTTNPTLHDTFPPQDTYSIGPVFGLGVGKDNVSVAWVLRKSERTGQFPAIWQGYAQSIELRVRF